ncbi:MAG: tRNA (adenosine(37)-N6)-threonylcarbamoyltransferase complex dimerization subunit type 1 TsaB [Oscillospiraceae bacterium]|nr:tRNA (adenosine(37)-N6)-threonylcarbamoyltransferase complex dimerization subunit type 1 TsaB [Oscillospiraceae bacterium]
MKILAFDSSAKVAAVSVCTEDKILAETVLDTGLTHSHTLLPICSALLKTAQLELADIDGFAVSIGPGSFTGLRIGLAAVKGMAFGLDKPCYPVSTLEALSYNLNGLDGIACPVMDARRGQVYNALFSLENGSSVRLCEDRAISIEMLYQELAQYEGTVWLCGDGAELCYRKLSELSDRIRLAPMALRFQRASGVAAAAFHGGEPISASQLTPQYLRLTQAERERAERERAKMTKSNE